jgi:hypothetical protein
MSGEGLDKSGGIQITTVTMFIGHVWSRTGHIHKTSLKSGGGVDQASPVHRTCSRMGPTCELCLVLLSHLPYFLYIALLLRRRGVL